MLEKTNNEYKVGEIAKICGINRNTLQGYLRDVETFPPVGKNGAGHRLYDDQTVLKLNLFRKMKKRPFRLTEIEIKKIFQQETLDELVSKQNQSNRSLVNYLQSKNLT